MMDDQVSGQDVDVHAVPVGILLADTLGKGLIDIRGNPADRIRRIEIVEIRDHLTAIAAQPGIDGRRDGVLIVRRGR